MKTVMAILAGSVVLFVVLMLLAPRNEQAASKANGLPWQIDVLADGGSRVFGLTLGGSTPGGSTLDDARTLLKLEPQVAVVTAAGEAGQLEAYFDTVTAGFVTGKLILTLDVTDAGIEGMRKRAVKTEYMESLTRKAKLSSEDFLLAGRAAIRAIAFIPSANLDESMIMQRFGAPAERIRGGEDVEHFLYPAKGLDLVLDAKKKELLQYVAPRDFARLSEPLRAKSSGAAQPYR